MNPITPDSSGGAGAGVGAGRKRSKIKYCRLVVADAQQTILRTVRVNSSQEQHVMRVHVSSHALCDAEVRVVLLQEEVFGRDVEVKHMMRCPLLAKRPAPALVKAESLEPPRKKPAAHSAARPPHAPPAIPLPPPAAKPRATSAPPKAAKPTPQPSAAAVSAVAQANARTAQPAAGRGPVAPAAPQQRVRRICLAFGKLLVRADAFINRRCRLLVPRLLRPLAGKRHRCVRYH